MAEGQAVETQENQDILNHRKYKREAEAVAEGQAVETQENQDILNHRKYKQEAVEG